MPWTATFFCTVIARFAVANNLTEQTEQIVVRRLGRMLAIEASIPDFTKPLSVPMVEGGSDDTLSANVNCALHGMVSRVHDRIQENLKWDRFGGGGRIVPAQTFDAWMHALVRSRLPICNVLAQPEQFAVGDKLPSPTDLCMTIGEMSTRVCFTALLAGGSSRRAHATDTMSIFVMAAVNMLYPNLAEDMECSTTMEMLARFNQLGLQKLMVLAQVCLKMDLMFLHQTMLAVNGRIANQDARGSFDGAGQNHGVTEDDEQWIVVEKIAMAVFQGLFDKITFERVQDTKLNMSDLMSPGGLMTLRSRLYEQKEVKQIMKQHSRRMAEGGMQPPRVTSSTRKAEGEGSLNLVVEPFPMREGMLCIHQIVAAMSTEEKEFTDSWWAVSPHAAHQEAAGPLLLKFDVAEKDTEGAASTIRCTFLSSPSAPATESMTFSSSLGEEEAAAFSRALEAGLGPSCAGARLVFCQLGFTRRQPRLIRGEKL